MDYFPCRNPLMEVGANILQDLFPREAKLICETWQVWKLLTFRNEQGRILGWFRLNHNAGSVPPVCGRDWGCWFGLEALFHGTVLELWALRRLFASSPFPRMCPRSLNELSMLIAKDQDGSCKDE